MPAMRLTRSASAPLLGGKCTVICEMNFDFVHVCAGHGFISIPTDKRKASILPAQLRQSISDSNPTQAHIAEKNILMTLNKARFDDYSFPFRKQKMVKQFQSDNSTDILHKNPSDAKWIPYNRLHMVNYTRVHYDLTSDILVMLVNTEFNTGFHHLLILIARPKFQ
jgi:hypothetical protein